jgi:hypothetical protein
MLPIDDPDVWWRFQSVEGLPNITQSQFKTSFQAMKWESRGSIQSVL